MSYKRKESIRSHYRLQRRVPSHVIFNSSSEGQFRTLVIQNVRLAKRLGGGQLPTDALDKLRTLTADLGLSLALGDIKYLDSGWYVTHAGLLRLARRDHCSGIQVRAVREFCDPAASRWVFKASVYKSRGSKGFVGYGDADPSNVSALVHGAEMRVAETRAVNRALRKAYGIGLCSVEELGWSPRPAGANQSNQNAPSASGNNGHQNGQPRLRDRLCLLIRQHRLDASLVKAYAADYCGTGSLRDASREQVEAFINHLTERALNDREALLCHLNSYPKQEEAGK
jgi:hypothetical protein